MIQGAASEASFTISQLIPWFATLLSVAFNWRMAGVVTGAKLEIKAEGDLLRRELATALEKLESKFVPAQTATIERANLEKRVEKLEDGVNKNRERHHEMANKFTELIMGPIQQINDRLADKARRMSGYEERERMRDEQIRELEDRVRDIHGMMDLRGGHKA